MGNCSTCTCNDKGEIQTFEVQVDSKSNTNGYEKKTSKGEKSSNKQVSSHSTRLAASHARSS